MSFSPFPYEEIGVTIYIKQGKKEICRPSLPADTVRYMLLKKIMRAERLSDFIMKKGLKKVVTLGLAAVMLLQFTGCEDKKASNDKVTLRLWTKPSQDAKEDEIQRHDEWLAMMKEKFPNVIFDEVVKPGGTDYRQEYDKALMAGTAPAYMAEFSYTDIPSRIKNGTVADITKYVENWDLKKDGKILTTFDDAISSNGKWYALPYAAYTQASLVNKKLLRENGESETDFPKTWEEFAAQGQKITDLSVPRIGYALMGMDWCAWPFTAWVWSAGGEMVRSNGDGTYKIAFNEPEGVDAAVFMNEMIWKYKMTQKDVLMSIDDLYTMSKNNTAVYSWATLANLDETAVERYNLNLDDFTVAPLPVKDSSIAQPALAGGEVITFNPKLSEEELAVAVEVAKYSYFSDEMMDRDVENIKKYNLVNIKVPGRVDYYEKRLDANSSMNEEKKADLVKMTENAKPEPYCEHWSDLKTELINPLQEIFLTEGITRDKVQKLLDDCADRLYELYPDAFKK